MRALALAALLVALPLLAGCAALSGTREVASLEPLAAVTLVDPLAEGPLAVAFADYDAGEAKVGGTDEDHSEYEYDARLRGRVWYPEAPGAYPLLVFLHGQHPTCAMGNEEAWLALDDCSDDAGVNRPYPNHLGYGYLATHLASHGYVVASVLAHEVNSRNGPKDVGMWARGDLLLATLDAFRDANAGVPSEAVARSDLARVGLMGHSRGGEGVVTALHVNLARPEAERHALRAVVALAPTDFNELDAPGVAFLTLIPACDGDVASLVGLRIFDRSRHLDDGHDRVQVVVRGTNHNFYNTRWYDDAGLPLYPGDDAPMQMGARCSVPRELGGARWDPLTTQQEGIVHIGGFLRWKVGGEAGLAPHFTGALPLPEAACPTGAACAQEVGVTAALVDSTRVLVVEAAVPKTHALGGEVRLDGFSSVGACEGRRCDPYMGSLAPALALSWRGPATLTLRMDEGVDWSAEDVLTFRVAAAGWDAPGAPRVDVGVTLVDGEGPGETLHASEHGNALVRSGEPSLPMNVRDASRLALQAVRIPLDAFSVDASDVREVVLSFEGEGTLFLTDVAVAREPDVL